MTTVRKLIVEVVDARNLIPRDGNGQSSPYAIVDFHGQRRKTKTIVENLNPSWNEMLKFNVEKTSTSKLFGDIIELNVFHDWKFGPTTRSKFLGRVRLNSGQFITKCKDLIYYPLQKKKCWSYIHGEIGLKVYFVDEVVPRPPVPNPAPTPAPQPPKKTEMTTVPPAPPAETVPPYAWVNEYKCYSRTLAEESYPDDTTDLSLASILIVFLLWFLILCLILF